MVVIFLLLVDHQTGEGVPNLIEFLDPLTYLDVVFLYILSYIKSVQLVFMSFSAIIVQYVVVLLFMAEYEFRIFLLYHLDPHLPGLPFFLQNDILLY